MTIEWFDSNKALPTVTVAAYGLTLNTSAALYFKDAQKVRLGLDADSKKAFLKAALESDDGAFTFPEVEDKSTARISCRDFVQYLSIILGLPIDQSNKYYASWSDDMLVIDLDKKIQKNKKTKRPSV